MLNIKAPAFILKEVVVDAWAIVYGDNTIEEKQEGVDSDASTEGE
jgi:hypothetical protein